MGKASERCTAVPWHFNLWNDLNAPLCCIHHHLFDLLLCVKASVARCIVVIVALSPPRALAGEQWVALDLQAPSLNDGYDDGGDDEHARTTHNAVHIWFVEGNLHQIHNTSYVVVQPTWSSVRCQ